MTPIKFPGVEESGKADNFLKFITHELKSFIDKEYRTNNYNMLAGHSFGGLFVAYTLIVDSESFQARFAFSPSLRFLGEDLYSDLKKSVKQNTARKQYLYMNVGAEQDRVLAAFNTVSTILKEGSPSLRWKAVELTEETHFTTPVIGQFQAFRDLFSGWKLTLPVSRQGVSAINDFYQSLSQQVGYDVKPEEGQVNNAAYEVLQVTGDVEVSREIFELNRDKYPESPNAYIGLARIHEMKNEPSLAAEQLEKAISLMDETDSRYAELKNRLFEFK
jgi:hypothetical protein